MTDTHKLVRIAAGQSPGAAARQALMIGADELRIFTYREPYKIGDTDQAECLAHTLSTELNAVIPTPERPGVHYLIILDGVPVLIPEDKVEGVVFGIVLARAGVKAARRVTFRPDMLPLP